MLRLRRFRRQLTLFPVRPTSRPSALPAWVNLVCLSIKKRFPLRRLLRGTIAVIMSEVEALRRDITADTFAATTGKPLRGQWATVGASLAAWARTFSGPHAVRRFNVAEWIVRGLRR